MISVEIRTGSKKRDDDVEREILYSRFSNCSGEISMESSQAILGSILLPSPLSYAKSIANMMDNEIRITSVTSFLSI